MSTNIPRPQPAAAKIAPAPILTSNQNVRHAELPRVPSALPEEPRKSAGYGLPCSKCHLYYPANLDHCPTCNHRQRVSPAIPSTPRKVAQAASSPVPDVAALEREREEFLRQFKSQRMEMAAEPRESACRLCEHDAADDSEAEVCKACYDRLQERVDICEAALHIDLQEAAQIVYDAVWADPSDPGKTYENAAEALLAELRKRAGMKPPLNSFPALEH